MAFNNDHRIAKVLLDAALGDRMGTAVIDSAEMA